MKTHFFFLLFCSLISTLVIGQDLNTLIDDYQVYLDAVKEEDKISWEDVSTAAIMERRKTYQQFSDRLEQLDQKAFSEQDYINSDLLTLIFNDKIANIDNEAYLMPLSAEGGFIISMIYATRGLKLKYEKGRVAYRDKILGTPKYMDQQIAHLSNGLEKQITMPKLVVQNCLDIIQDLLTAESFFLFEPIENLSIEEKKNVTDAFLRLQDFLQAEYIPATREKVGVVNNANGKKFYEQRVSYFTTTDMTPQDVFDTGMAEVTRIRAEMQAIIDSLKFEGSYADFLEFLRTDPQFYVDTPQELLMHASWLTVKAQEILPKYFSNLPALPLTVNPVPAAIAPNYTTGRYSGGSMKSKQAGQYWVNTYNLPARPLFVLPALTLHEGVPGHHLQISLAKELTDLPKFRKTQYLSAYGEGWGLYAEYLGKEAGIYTTLYQDFGRLTYEMWRACRLVVDPGMHYFDWTREKAYSFMKENTALSIHEINTEINRYIGWPGQAVSYKIGELKIRELRSMAETELGEDFDIRSFHDKVLENGSIPLYSLERIIKSYIAEEKQK